MRLKVAQRFGVVALYVLAHLGVQACSDSADDGGDVAADGDKADSGDGEAKDDSGGDKASTEETASTDAAAPADGATGDAAAPASNANDTAASIAGEVNAPANGGAAAAPANATAAAPAAAPAADAKPADAKPAVADAGSSATAGNPMPEMGSKMPYIVQHGDTLAKISQKIFGDSGKWSKIAELSGLANNNRIYPGDVVYYQLNQDTQNFAKAYETAARAEVQANSGDTLAAIAKRVLGSSADWKSIWRQNDKINNPDVITPGQTIYYVSQQALNAALSKYKTNTNVASVHKTKTHNHTVNFKVAKTHNTKTVNHANQFVSTNVHSNHMMSSAI